MSLTIPTQQTAAIVRFLGAPVEYVTDHPVPKIKPTEVLAKVLYSGVCQSDLHTKEGTAGGADGQNITNIKLPHIGGHEGVGRVMVVGDAVKGVKQDALVGIRFEYIALDGDNLTILPDDVDPVTIGPVLCAGVTAYKCVKSCQNNPGEWMVIIGAAGGMGHLAIQYAKVMGARVIAIDGGEVKKDLCLSLGAEHYIDFLKSDTVNEVLQLTSTGAHSVVCTSGNAKAYASAAEMLRVGGTLACGGIPPGTPPIETSIGKIVIKGLKIVGCLVGSLKETLEAVELTRLGMVKPIVEVRDWKEISQVYEDLQKDRIKGRVVVKVAREP
ncbi:hypothetical protein D1P53_004471 [Cryptococcus gattii VGV]|nr:hypothetical protein D1P53_004471 [Cryptococcus gattii VGV]